MEWGLTPEYIFSNWTEEEFDLMISKMNKRHKARSEPEEQEHNRHFPTQERTTVQDISMFTDLESSKLGFTWNRRKEN